MQDKSREHDQTEADSPAGPSATADSATQSTPDGTADGSAESAPDGAAQSAPVGTTESAAVAAPEARPRTRWSRPGRLALGIGAAVTAAIVAFAAFAATGGLSGPARASSVIPSPPRQNRVFVEDDDGTGADNQANILTSAAPGLVHVVTPRGTPAGAGLILTPSGLVLTSAQVLQGGRQVTVRVVLSGRSFPARLVGTSSSYDLALLQIVGGPAFRPVAVGNSRDLSQGAAVTAVGSSGLTKTFTLNIGNLTGRTGAVAAAGQRLTGLLVSTARVLPGEETGGPLVNLSGQAIGINVAGAGSGLHHTGFAVPMNQALAVARQIQATHSG